MAGHELGCRDKSEVHEWPKLEVRLGLIHAYT